MSTDTLTSCRKCGSPLADDHCTDETCPYSNAPQSARWDGDGYRTDIAAGLHKPNPTTPIRPDTKLGWFR